MPTAQMTQNPGDRLTMQDLGAQWPIKPWPAPVTLKPEPTSKPNAEAFPTLAALGFIFPEAINTGSIVEPPCACPTCGRTVERIPAP